MAKLMSRICANRLAIIGKRLLVLCNSRPSSRTVAQTARELGAARSFHSALRYTGFQKDSARTEFSVRSLKRYLSTLGEEHRIFSEKVFDELLEKRGREEALAFAQQYISDDNQAMSLSSATARVAYALVKYFKKPRRSTQDLKELRELLRLPAAAGFPHAQYLLGLTYQEQATLQAREQNAAFIGDLRALASSVMRDSNLTAFPDALRNELQRARITIGTESLPSAESEDAEGRRSVGDSLDDLYDKSFHYVQLAAGSGVPEAKTALAAFFLEGIHPVRADPAKALKLLEEAADEGDLNAYVQLAAYYRETKPSNIAKALGCLKHAANMGDMHAEHELGCIYIMGDLGQDIDYAKGMDQLQKAASKGHPDAHFVLARIFCGTLLHEVYDGPIALSLKRFHHHIAIAADLEHAGAMQFLAEAIYAGKFEVERDYEKALRLFFDAAQIHAEEQNIQSAADCLYTAGMMVYHGLGIQRNAKHAFFVLQAAHELGSLPATRFLSIMYKDGDGTAKNEKMAQYLGALADSIF
jgi:TPR repeat protein